MKTRISLILSHFHKTKNYFRVPFFWDTKENENERVKNI